MNAPGEAIAGQTVHLSGDGAVYSVDYLTPFSVGFYLYLLS
jgi:hypothetical protein